MNVGEIQATLILRDQMTPVLRQAEQAANKFSGQLEGMGTSGASSLSNLRAKVDELLPSGASVESMFTDLKGTLGEMFEHPIGAVKDLGGALATDLAGGLGTVAIGAAATAGALAAVGLAAFKLADNAAETGARLDDLHDVSDIAVPALSRFKNALDVMGRPLEQITSLAFRMNAQMATSPDTFAEGLARIGLTLKDIEGLDTDERITAIAHGFQQAGPQVNKAASALELFGKSGRDALPMLMDLDKAMAMTADVQPWTAAQAAEAEHFEMQLSSLKVHAEALGMSLGRTLIPIMSDVVSGFVSVGGEALSLVGRFTGVTAAAESLASAWRTAAAAVDLLRGKTAELPDVTGNAQKALDKWNESVSARAHLDLPDALKNEKSIEADLAAQYEVSHKAAEDAKKAADELAKAYQTLTITTAGYQGVLDTVDGGTIAAIESELQHGAAVADVAKVYGVAQAAVQQIAEHLKDEQKELDDTVDRMAKFRAEGVAAAGVLGKQLAPGLTVFAQTLGDIPIQAKAATEALNQFKTVAANSGQQTIMGPMLMPDLSGLAAKHMAELNPGTALLDGMDTALKQLPALITTAFTTGGGVKGAVAGAGSLMGSTLLANLGEKFSDGLGKTLGGIFGSVLPGLGSLIGPALTGLFSFIGNIGGPSKAELDARKSQADLVDELRKTATEAQRTEGAMTDTYHTIAIVARDAFRAVGMGADEADSHIKDLLNTHDPAAYRRGADALAAALDTAKTRAGLVSTEVDDIVKAAGPLGAGDKSILEPTLRALADMPGLTEDEKKALKGLTDQAVPDFANLEGIAKSYGLSLSSLGPAFQQADLSKTAAKIFDDFTNLKNAGADVGGTLYGMRTKIGDLVGAAQQFGGSIPAAMKPLIEELIRSGNLTDSAGHKFDDLKAIKFDDSPVDAGVQGVDDKVAALVKTLSGPGGAYEAVTSVSQAIDAIPNATRYIDIITRYHTEGEPPSGGGDTSDAQPHAIGGEGHVSSPTLMLVGESGPEDYAFSGANRSFSDEDSGSVDTAALEGLMRQMVAKLDRLPLAFRDAVDRMPQVRR